jgi:hypothetical protein
MATSFTNQIEFLQVTSKSFVEVNKSFDLIDSIDCTEFEFQGFDPEKLSDAIYKKIGTKDKKTILNDIIRIVVIALMRGNVRRDTIQRSDPRGIIKINNLIADYGISVREKAGQKLTLKNDTITFVRCLSVFPFQASIILHKNPKIAKCTSDDLSLGCPVALRHAGASGIIPEGEAGNILLLCHIAHMIDMGATINPRDRKKSNLERFEEARRFAKMGRESKFIHQVQRCSFMRSLDMDLKENFEISLACANRLFSWLNKPLIEGIPPMDGNRIKFSEDKDTYDKYVREAAVLSAVFKVTFSGVTSESVVQTGKATTFQVEV